MHFAGRVQSKSVALGPQRKQAVHLSCGMRQKWVKICLRTLISRQGTSGSEMRDCAGSRARRAVAGCVTCRDPSLPTPPRLGLQGDSSSLSISPEGSPTMSQVSPSGMAPSPVGQEGSELHSSRTLCCSCAGAENFPCNSCSPALSPRPPP